MGVSPTIKTPILYGLGHMCGYDIGTCGQIRNSAGDFEDTVI